MYDEQVIYSLIDDRVNHRCKEVNAGKPQYNKNRELKPLFKGQVFMKPGSQYKQIKQNYKRLKYP